MIARIASPTADHLPASTPTSFAKPRTNMAQKKNTTNGHRKPLSPVQLRQRQLDREEMQSLLAKLKQLVPGIPKNRRLTKLEIIQHVIDYIFDLQTALEQHPIASTMAASAMAAADFRIHHHHHNHHQSPSTPSTHHHNIHNDSNNNNCYHTTQAQPRLPPQHNISCISSQPHLHHNHHNLPQRIPGGQNRQPLASIVL